MFEADVLLKADILLKWNQVQDDWQTSWSPIRFMILLSRVSIDVLEDKSVEFKESLFCPTYLKTYITNVTIHQKLQCKMHFACKYAYLEWYKNIQWY